MPRIKAMTTGSTPSFLDVILNFAEGDKSSSLESQDTWLGQLKAKRDGRLVFYGDDTWLKLFPTTFARAEGTSSFFVSVSGHMTRQRTVGTQTESRAIGFHRSGLQCDQKCTWSLGPERLDWHDPALSRP